MKIAEKLKVTLKRILSLELGRIATDKQELVFDGELEVGTEVFVEDENADFVPAPDGEYLAEDGRTIVVADGVVAEIREPEPQNEPEPEEQEPVEAEEIEEPAADPIEEQENEEQESLEDKVARLEGIVTGYSEAIENRLANVENKIADLEGTPAADPAEEVEAEDEKPKNRLAYLRKN